jgi:hypothetical protein
VLALLIGQRQAPLVSLGRALRKYTPVDLRFLMPARRLTALETVDVANREPEGRENGGSAAGAVHWCDPA